MNSTPFVRQYGILNNEWGVLNAKGSAKQAIYARIQGNGNGDDETRRTQLYRNRETV